MKKVEDGVYSIRDVVSHRRSEIADVCINRGRTLRDSKKTVYVTNGGRHINCRNIWFCNLCGNGGSAQKRLLISESDYRTLKREKVLF